MNTQHARPVRLLFITGISGAGKDTLKDSIIEQIGHAHADYVAPGDVARGIQDPTSEISQRFGEQLAPYRDYASQGRFLPGPVTLRVLGELAKEKIREGKQLIIVAGAPRALDQVELMREMIEDIKGMKLENNQPLQVESRILIVDTDKEVARQRLLERNRHDDTPEVIESRFRHFDEQVQPAIDIVIKEDGGISIDGNQGKEQVYAEMIEKLGSFLDIPMDVEATKEISHSRRCWREETIMYSHYEMEITPLSMRK